MPNTENAQRKNQVLEVLEERYFPMLPTRLPSRPEEEQRKDRFSRSLAAFAIQKLSGCSETLAAEAVVDCGDDNGIDAIYYDPNQNTLWLAQSKYGNAPGRAENLTFCTGVRDLLAERYDRFRHSGENPEFDRVQSNVEDALQAVETKIVACVVHMGNPLGSHAISDLEQLKTDHNESKEWVSWLEIDLQTVRGWLAEEHNMEALQVQLTLTKWNIITTPRRAVYGTVKASELETLHRQYGNALFTQNIRYFLGRQSVNSDIISTVSNAPSELFFLNNGLTAICANFNHPGNNKDQTTFTLDNFSIVNGAQTVGSIGTAGQDKDIAEDAQLLITIIAVGEGEDAIELGSEITRTRNTQNRVNRNDFIALDPNQERLRQELAISDVVYHYRPSADMPNQDEDQFSLEDATRALACFSGNTSIIVTAKKEIGQVYDRDGSFYSTLFRDDLSGAKLYRLVQIYRYADGLFTSSENAAQGRQATFYRHARYFILHIWARRSRTTLNKAELILSEDDKLQISDEILELTERIYTLAESMFAGSEKGYLAIFRNLTDAVPLAQAVMRDINQENEA